MSTTILAPIALCVLGIVFGAILAVAAKVFAVEKDPREEAIAECLPGANCGGCARPVDMFPHTAGVETVALLSKGETSSE